MSVDLHPNLGPLAGLAGTWAGEGAGHYPTIEDFTYLEQVTFTHVGKPFFAYAQRTRHPATGAPMHSESGYLRVVTPAPERPVRVELVVAHPFGIVEVDEGEFHEGVLDLRATGLGRTSTAKAVHALRRRFVLEGDTLAYDLWMAHADTPETHHLAATLHRTADAS
ncbi:MAG TPA: FABP family protein [Egicoccus sp.]|nr:FABP family protein [Egicoccus sp.]HSK24714.1 FABP family protein [Egicoccus sp.]